MKSRYFWKRNDNVFARCKLLLSYNNEARFEQCYEIGLLHWLQWFVFDENWSDSSNCSNKLLHCKSLSTKLNYEKIGGGEGGQGGIELLEYRHSYKWNSNTIEKWYLHWFLIQINEWIAFHALTTMGVNRRIVKLLRLLYGNQQSTVIE